MQSPGHRQYPDHAVRERHLGDTFEVTVRGRTLGRSDDVIEVAETGHPKRYYFPRSALDMTQLERTEKTSKCPFKGTANYYSLRSDGQAFDNIAWTYEHPYDEHSGLTERLAFYDENEGVEVRPARA